ncbi:MAG TPA: tRNA (adenosine(37)-N6)-threonylcarbamoyltransferase complex ATPase subunit type 1 TsaE [Ferrovibrio sp.]|jgi:tRNA threonylcarbamoyladenosine biosynthesis protein TsaE|uniref:tRNA (adenosine(37)-N6)-threonylcarbamoyltransferase complex ATPase subunit type 1 TsaE n=1 Tax=Ferrovibrio sp. TaxID=1917215 RepID=UPI002ED0B2FF
MPVIRSLRLPDEAATAAFAAAMAPLLRPGDALLLDGPLGAGKTSFARALIRSLSNPEAEVPSPSFNLVLTYDTPVATLWHFDLYRIGDPRELDELGIEEALSDGITLIEWPERLGAQIPADALTIRFSAVEGDADQRDVALIGGPRWQQRLSSLSSPAHA